MTWSYRRIPGSSNASRYLHPALCLCPLAAHYHKPQSSPSEVPVRASPPAYLVSQKPAGFSGCPPPHRPSRPLIGSRFLNDDEETRNQKGFSVFPTRKARRVSARRALPEPQGRRSRPALPTSHSPANPPAPQTHKRRASLQNTWRSAGPELPFAPGSLAVTRDG